MIVVLAILGVLLGFSVAVNIVLVSDMDNKLRKMNA